MCPISTSRAFGMWPKRPKLPSWPPIAAAAPSAITPRNLRDEQLRALAEKGGVVAITFVPDFIDAHNPTFDGLLDHIEHAVAVAGIDHVGLGSDFDGGGLLLEDATCLPDIAVGLANRGYAEADVRKILGANQLRFLQQVIG